MSKVILSLTVAGLVSGAAFGQSKFDSGLCTTIYDVKAGMYGVADVAYCYSRGGAGFVQSASGAYTPVDAASGVSNTRTYSGLQNGVWKNSRLGFNAEENLGLGHGLKALALMEFAVTVPLSNGLSTTRQAYLGVDSDYGRVTAGKLEVASTDAIVRNSALEAITSSPTTTLQRTLISSKNLNNGTTVLTTMVTGAAAWWNNSIGYQSKTYSGFSGRVFYSFGETGEQANGTGITYGTNGSSTAATTANSATAGSSDNERVSAGVNYAQGPVNLDLVYQGMLKIRNAYPQTGSAANKLEGGSINEWYVGGSYKFSWMKVMATYQTTASSLYTATIGQLGETLWTAGVVVPVSKTTKLRLEYAHVKFNQGATAQPVAALRRNGGSGSWGFGLTNELSKHATYYAILTRTQNDMNTIEQDVNGTGVDVRGASNTMFATGLSFAF